MVAWREQFILHHGLFGARNRCNWHCWCVLTAIANSLQGRLILGTQVSFAIRSRNKIESQSLERGNIFKGLSTGPFNYREVSEIVHSSYSGNKAIGK
jgi:hypothetical protein